MLTATSQRGYTNTNTNPIYIAPICGATEAGRQSIRRY